MIGVGSGGSRRVLRALAIVAVLAGVIALLVPTLRQLHSLFRPPPAPLVARPAGDDHRGRASRPQPTAGSAHRRLSKALGTPGRHPDETSAAPERTIGKVERAVLKVGVGLLALFGLAVVSLSLTATRRLYNRGRRDYQRWPLHLSMHDDAKPEDLADMVEAMVDALRPRLGRRFASGQPFCALELLYDGIEWTLCLVCERRTVGTLEGIITQAYPDVWLGRAFAGSRTPVSFELGTPGHVLRFHKRREWMLPLSRSHERSGDRRERPSAAIEGIARAQVQAGTPSVVRFQMIPMAEGLERRMSRQLSAWQRRMQHAAPSTGDKPGSLTLSEHAQLTSAVEVQDRSLLFLEVQVAAQDWDTANAIASSVMARRGENHLHRRYTRLRQRLYRRRFASATPPWLPSPTGKSIVSSAEVAFLFELPSARMKSVPVRRITRPRIPRPPEAAKPRGQTEFPPPAPSGAEARQPEKPIANGAAPRQERTVSTPVPSPGAEDDHRA